MADLKLHAYQERAIEFCMDNPSAYLAIDMGLGKTAISLKVIERLKQSAMVLGPLNTILSTWPDEIAKWTPGLTYRVLHGANKSLDGIDQVDILLMNYEGLTWFTKQTAKWKRRIIIYDEASMVKSHSTQRFKLLRSLSNLWTPTRLALSATPAPNSLHELWSQYYLLDSGARLGKNISEFRRRYCSTFSYPGMAFTKYEVRDEKKQEIYEAIEDITFRLDAKDYLDMPEITYNTIPCKLTPALTKKYKQLEDDFFLRLDQGIITVTNAAQLSMKLRQFIQGGIYNEEGVWEDLHEIKLRRLKELLDTSAGRPIICAIQFKGELKSIHRAFGSVPIIAGGISGQDRKKYIDAWNAGSLPLLLCHPASLSHGVNLQSGGATVLWYGLTWSLEQYYQLNGRVYRQGQKNAVIIHHLVMQNTVDELVLRAINNKAAGLGQLLDYFKNRRSLE